jgi:hypothetical protein
VSPVVRWRTGMVPGPLVAVLVALFVVGRRDL